MASECDGWEDSAFDEVDSEAPSSLDSSGAEVEGGCLPLGNLMPRVARAAFHSCSNFAIDAFKTSFSRLSSLIASSSSTSMSGTVSVEEVDVIEAREDDWTEARDRVEDERDNTVDRGVTYGVGSPWSTDVGIAFAEAPRAARRTRTSSSSSATRPSR